jgi:hypothetical protein
MSSRWLSFFFFFLPLTLPQSLPPVVASAACTHLFFSESWTSSSSIFFLPSSIQHKQIFHLSYHFLKTKHLP